MSIVKKVVRKIEKIENLNYGLYIAICIFIGFVLFVSTYFVGSSATEYVVTNGMGIGNWRPNPVNYMYSLEKVDSRGFNVTFNSKEKVKVSYYLGSLPESMSLFSQSDGFVTFDVQQFRSLIPSKIHYFQVEIEKENGEVLRSDVREIENSVVE
jgi:hypothetical protein